jgi:hypothetical protein
MNYSLFESESFYMPEEYKGEIMKGGGLTKNLPRKWTEKEIEWVKMLQEKKINNKQISEYIYRDVTQVSIKIKRLGKKNKTYNDRHRIEKYHTNQMFIDKYDIKSVLDVYSGEKSFYLDKIKKVVTNDKETSFNTDFHYDSLTLCCLQYASNNKYDLVDLDPFGSAYDCFDLAIKMATKCIIITLGELGHKRFKRLDFVSRHYDINDLNDFTTDNIIKEIVKIGRRNKKELIPVFVKDWRNIARVYFEIKNIKIDYLN